MDHWFDDAVKDLATNTVSRRGALRRIAAGFGGAAIATLIPGHVFANTMPKCTTGGNCDIGFSNCGTNSNCYCFQAFNGQARCGCNAYCDELSTCSTSDECPEGYVCIVNNGCTGCGNSAGVCIPLCNSTCTLSAPALTAGTHRSTAAFG